MLAWYVDGNAEAGEPDSAVCHVYEDIRWLDVFVYETALMHLSQSTRERDCDVKEFGDLQGAADPPIERLASRVLEHQGQAATAARQGGGPCRPSNIQVGSQSVFVLEPVEARERGLFRGNEQDRCQSIAATPVEGKSSFP
jgi:hypothetical protein